MKPVSIKGYREKQIRKLRKEQRELWKKSWELGYRKLEKPIRFGWFKELKILPQLERYKVKSLIEEIVEKLETQIWGPTKEVAQKRWNHAQSKHLIYKDVPTISPKAYRKLSDKAKKLCTVFFFRDNKKWRRRYYVRIPKHAYKISFRRAYVTHSKIIDPQIEERLDLIEAQFNKKGWYAAAHKDQYKSRWKINEVKTERKQVKRELKNHQYRSLTEIKKEY